MAGAQPSFPWGKALATALLWLILAPLAAGWASLAALVVGAVLWRWPRLGWGAFLAVLGGVLIAVPLVAVGPLLSALFYSPAQDTRWGGRVTRVVVDPANPGVLYAWHQTAGLIRFTEADPSSPRQVWTPPYWTSSGEALAFDPHHRRILYVTAGHTIYALDTATARVMDQWESEPKAYFISPIVPDPARHGVWYVLGNSGGRLFRTVDGGASWSMLNEKFGPDAWLRSFAMDGQDSQVLYASVGRKGDWVLMKSVDGGESWQPTGLELDGRIVVSPVAQLLYVMQSGPDARIYRSQDAAEHWEGLDWPSGLVTKTRQLVPDPLDADVAYAWTWNATQSQVLRTTDRGDTWELDDAAPLPGDVHGLTVVAGPAGSSRLYGVVRSPKQRLPALTWSDDGGKTWSP
jgi:hypothetical protein